jgi:hypothetical protein
LFGPDGVASLCSAHSDLHRAHSDPCTPRAHALNVVCSPKHRHIVCTPTRAPHRKTMASQRDCVAILLPTTQVGSPPAPHRYSPSLPLRCIDPQLTITFEQALEEDGEITKVAVCASALVENCTERECQHTMFYNCSTTSEIGFLLVTKSRPNQTHIFIHKTLERSALRDDASCCQDNMTALASLRVPETMRRRRRTHTRT